MGSCNNVASALDGNTRAPVIVRTRPLGQLKGEGRVGLGGGEILRCGHKREFNCAECNFCESPDSVFCRLVFVPFSQTVFTVTGRMMHAMKSHNQSA